MMPRRATHALVSGALVLFGCVQVTMPNGI